MGLGKGGVQFDGLAAGLDGLVFPQPVYTAAQNGCLRANAIDQFAQRPCL